MFEPAIIVFLGKPKIVPYWVFAIFTFFDVLVEDLVFIWYELNKAYFFIKPMITPVTGVLFFSIGATLPGGKDIEKIKIVFMLLGVAIIFGFIFVHVSKKILRNKTEIKALLFL